VHDAKIGYSGSKRGWAGDVVVTNLDINLLTSFGWKSKVGLEEGVSHYIQWLVDAYGSVF